jgi:hypothetical protein
VLKEWTSTTTWNILFNTGLSPISLAGLSIASFASLIQGIGCIYPISMNQNYISVLSYKFNEFYASSSGKNHDPSLDATYCTTITRGVWDQTLSINSARDFSTAGALPPMAT